MQIAQDRITVFSGINNCVEVKDYSLVKKIKKERRLLTCYPFSTRRSTVGLRGEDVL